MVVFFNPSFPLRDTTQIDQSIITNQYIADYIQFVPYSKVNEYLIEEIGLEETIFQEALQMLLINLEANVAIIDSQYPSSAEISSLHIANYATLKTYICEL